MVLWTSLSGTGRLSEEGELILRASLFTSLSYLVVALVAASPAVAEPPVPSRQRGSEGSAIGKLCFDLPDFVNKPYRIVSAKLSRLLLRADSLIPR
jgi:hypothetical protein